MPAKQTQEPKFLNLSALCVRAARPAEERRCEELLRERHYLPVAAAKPGWKGTGQGCVLYLIQLKSDCVRVEAAAAHAASGLAPLFQE